MTQNGRRSPFISHLHSAVSFIMRACLTEAFFYRARILVYRSAGYLPGVLENVGALGHHGLSMRSNGFVRQLGKNPAQFDRSNSRVIVRGKLKVDFHGGGFLFNEQTADMAQEYRRIRMWRMRSLRSFNPLASTLRQTQRIARLSLRENSYPVLNLTSPANKFETPTIPILHQMEG